MDTTSKDLFNFIVKELSPIFPHVEKRVRIWADDEKFRWKEDEDIWKQHKGKSVKEYEAYFDREFVCSFTQAQPPKAVYLSFIEGVRRLYKEGLIFVHEELYAVKDEEDKIKRAAQAEKEKIPEATTKEEAILREVLVKTKKKKKI